MRNKWHITIFIVLLTSVALFYRLHGLSLNTPFWVDEFSTANQSRQVLKYGLSVFTSDGVFFEPQGITTHFIVAAFFKFLGQSEFAARLPSVLFGSLVPLLLFLVGSRLFNRRIAISAALLSTFSYFQITWSRQARGYMLLQLLILGTIFVYHQLTTREDNRAVYRILFLTLATAGILTHTFFYIFLIALGIHFFLFQPKKIKNVLINPISFIFFFLLLFLAYNLGLIETLVRSVDNGMVGFNLSLKYYHSFLWREYGLIAFLALMGILAGVKFLKKNTALLLIYMLLHLIFVSLIYGHYISKYLLPIFPLILLFTAHGLDQFSRLLSKNTAVVVLLTLFIITNGHKFVTKPKIFYSVNHDFREIALIDYHQMYNLIKQNGDLPSGQTAVVDPWKDRAFWYLGQNIPYYYVFRWIDGGALEKRTPYTLDKNGQKILLGKEKIKLIGELADLKKVLDKYPKGFILIDDSTLPDDVITYAEKNFKKELYLDHYPLDDNPYSVWPATLYSWGV